MDRMTGLDATFLYLETPEQHMVINGVIELDVSTMDGGWSFDRFRSELHRRVKDIPQFRRKVYDSRWNVGHPAWIEDYDFDVDRHLHLVELPEGDAEDRLLELCGELASRPMDRSKPLWEAWVVENTDEEDHVAVFCRVHHSLLDGMSAADLLAMLAETGDTHPEHSTELVRTHAGSRNPVQLLVGGALDMARRPLAFARLLPETIAAPLAALRPSRGGSRSSEGMPAPFTAPRTVFNATLTPRRAIATVSLDLDELKEVKSAFGTTVNDVLLTVVGGALRTYLEQDGGLPEKSLVAIVPVSTRSDDLSGANQVSAMFATLGTDHADPVDRLTAIASRTHRGKAQSELMRPSLLADWARLAPEWLLGPGMWAYGAFHLADLHPVVHNLVVSNVPGPRSALHFLGARIRHMYPMGPIFHGAGLSVTGVSFEGTLDLGVISCEQLVPEPRLLADAMVDVLAELVEAARS